MSTDLLPLLRDVDVVISDVLTACGGLAAERAGIPWLELSPHPLYAPSRGLPPIGLGLEPGVGLRGRARDVVLRTLSGRSVRAGEQERIAARRSVGMADVGPPPARRLIATLPALEVGRPDWPAEAALVGPLLWEPTTDSLRLPDGDAPLVVVAPSTAATGADGMAEAALSGLAGLERPVRAVISTLAPGADDDLPYWACAGFGRQDAALAQASAVVCGGGHGMLAKALVHGVPAVVVPGGGDQYELARRAERFGAARVVRPVTTEAMTAALDAVLSDPSYRAAARRAAAGEGVELPRTDVVSACEAVMSTGR